LKGKPKIWTTAQADKKFSAWIRFRDGRCMNCGKETNLQCSHFWSRKHSSTRFDPDNCVAFCAGCHLFKMENEKQGIYRDFMIRWLGQDGYDKLEQKRYTTVSRKEAILELMSWMS
jgi:hypothetical protein